MAAQAPVRLVCSAMEQLVYHRKSAHVLSTTKRLSPKVLNTTPNVTFASAYLDQTLFAIQNQNVINSVIRASVPTTWTPATVSVVSSVLPYQLSVLSHHLDQLLQ